MSGYFICFLICAGATVSLVSSITLPYMTTHPPRRHTRPMNVSSRATVLRNGAVMYITPCVLFKANAVVEVSFKTHFGEDNADAYLLEDAVIDGNDCTYNDNAHMTIQWNGYTMRWNFAKTSDDEQWYVKEIELHLNLQLDQYHSLKALGLPPQFYRLYNKEMLFSTPLDKSYSCNESIVDLNVPSDVYNPRSLSGKLHLRMFHLQPYIKEGPNFGPAVDCRDEEK